VISWLDIIVQGVLVGGFYALFATGLSLIFGVMRLVNLAHGDFIVLAAFVALAIVQQTDIHPLLSLAALIPVMAGFGYLLQRFILNRTLGQDILPPLLVTFGLSIEIQNGLLLAFSADSQKLPMGDLTVKSVQILPGLNIGLYPLAVLVLAAAVIFALQLLLYKTPLGAALRATSDDSTTIRLMGIDNRHIFGLATALSFAVAALAGVLMGGYTNFDPASGPSNLLFGFEAIIIGGLGNLWGTLLGGMILGVAQAIGAEINPGFQVLAGHLAFLAIVFAAPRGLFPRMAA